MTATTHPAAAYCTASHCDHNRHPEADPGHREDLVQALHDLNTLYIQCKLPEADYHASQANLNARIGAVDYRAAKRAPLTSGYRVAAMNRAGTHVVSTTPSEPMARRVFDVLSEDRDMVQVVLQVPGLRGPRVTASTGYTHHTFAL